MDIIPFESSKLPAYLKQTDSSINDEMLAHASAAYPVISIKGKVFTTVRDGERSIIPNPKDPEAAAQSLEIVILKVNRNTSKIYYSKGYTEGSDAKPDCWSNDGIEPDPSAEHPQSSKCKTCKHSQWGSKISENGKKVKACNDAVRMAIAAPDQLNDPFLIRVPPASIRVLGEYGNVLNKRGIPYSAVVTRLGFDIEEATPKLTFKALGLVPEAKYKEVQELRDSDLVNAIIGASIIPTQEELETAPEEKEASEAINKAKAPAKAKASASDVVKATEDAVASINVDLNLDDVKFDD